MGLVIGEIWTYKATKPSDNLEKIRPVLVIGDDGDNGLEFVDIDYVIISSSASCEKYDVEITSFEDETLEEMIEAKRQIYVNEIDVNRKNDYINMNYEIISNTN